MDGGWRVAGWSVLLMAAAWGAETSRIRTVTPGEVWEAVQEYAGPRVGPGVFAGTEAVSWLAPARIAGEARVVVSAMAAGDRGGLLVHLRCEPAPACLPFLSRVERPRAAALGNLGALAREREPRPAPEPLLVRAGQPVMLWMERAGMRLHVPAKCLQPGARGTTVRARVKATRKVFQAEVIGEGQLRVKF